jgi:hypothetical protein
MTPTINPGPDTMFVNLRVNPGQEVPTGYDVICHGAMKDMDAELRYFLNPDARDTANKILADAHMALDRLNGAWDLIAADREAITVGGLISTLWANVWERYGTDKAYPGVATSCTGLAAKFLLLK